MTAYLIYSGFTLGLLSSLHCIGMCGPLALALPVGSLSPPQKEIGRSLYHLGRITTYSFLGVVFGLIGEKAKLFLNQQVFSLSLGLTVILFFVIDISKLHMLSNIVLKKFNPLNSKISKGPVFFYTFGMFNGFLPCTTVFLALSGAVASASMLNALIFMLFYGLGTVPLLYFFMFSGSKILKSFNFSFTKSTKYLAFVFSILLIIRGLNLKIPYLSPGITKTEITVCHEK